MIEFWLGALTVCGIIVGLLAIGARLMASRAFDLIKQQADIGVSQCSINKHFVGLIEAHDQRIKDVSQRTDAAIDALARMGK